MGKARKHSSGISSGFVHGYTQSVETDREIEEANVRKRSRYSSQKVFVFVKDVKLWEREFSSQAEDGAWTSQGPS